MWGVFRFRFLWHTTKPGTPEHETTEREKSEQWNTGGAPEHWRNNGIPWNSGTTEQQNNTTRNTTNAE